METVRLQDEIQPHYSDCFADLMIMGMKRKGLKKTRILLSPTDDITHRKLFTKGYNTLQYNSE